MKPVIRCADMMSQVGMLKQGVCSRSTTAPHDSVVGVNVPYGKETKYSVLVVRITADGQLGESKPCCMCVNIMKSNGIKRVYYSDEDGNMCVLKLNQIDNEDTYASHGLKLMIMHCTCTGTLQNKKLPLTKSQKSFLIKKGWT